MLHPALAIAGLLLIAVPIAIHLLNRRRFKTVQWAAMDFLLMAMRRNRRRLRFESWLLLATRCAVLALAGLALARPVGCADSALAGVAGREGGLSVFVIDDSASMAYRFERDDSATHFDHAKKLAARLIGRLADGSEQVAVVTASSPSRDVIAAPTFDLLAAARAIDALPQTNHATDLAAALDRASRVADEAPAGLRKTLYVLTDDTAGALPPGERLAAAARAAAGRYSIVWHNLAAPGQSNAAVLAVGPTDPLVRRGFDARFAATLQRFGGTRADANLTWRVDGAPVGVPATPPLTPDAKPIVNGDADLQSALADGRPHVLEAGLSPPDLFPEDDARRRVVEQVRSLPVLVVEGRRGSETGTLGGSGAFLAFALQPDPEAGYVSVTTISDLELPGRPLSPYRAVVLAGVGNLAEPTAQSLADFVTGGGVLMLWTGDATTAENYNAVLQPRGLLPGPLVQRVTAADDGLVGFDFDPDRPHPYLGAFRGVQGSGLNVPAIRQYWRIDLSPDRAADVVLRFLPTGEAGASGDAAVVTWPLGDGRVLMVTTAAGDPEWTLLPLKANYAAFVHELLSHAVGDASGGGTAWQTFEAGEPVVVPASLAAGDESVATATPTLAAPDGQPVDLTRRIRPGGSAAWESAPLEALGVYALKRGERTWPVVVNLPPSESDLRPLDEPAVRSLLGGIDLQMFGDDLPAEVGSAEEARADFGWSLLLIVLCLAAFECFLAMRFGRQRR